MRVSIRDNWTKRALCRVSYHQLPAVGHTVRLPDCGPLTWIVTRVSWVVAGKQLRPELYVKPVRSRAGDAD